jgi:hypothetical protein
VAETARDPSPQAAGSPGLRLFAWVIFATLVLDATTAQLHGGVPIVPAITGSGRWVIGLAAGFAGMRSTRRLVRTAVIAFAGMMLATLLTEIVYILTGRAAADRNGPGAVLALLVGSTAIALIAPTVGSLAWLAVQRARARKAA